MVELWRIDAFAGSLYMTLYERRGAGATAAVKHHPTSTKEFIKDDKHISCSVSIMKLIYRLLICWLHLVHTNRSHWWCQPSCCSCAQWRHGGDVTINVWADCMGWAANLHVKQLREENFGTNTLLLSNAIPAAPPPAIFLAAPSRQLTAWVRRPVA